MTFLALDSQRNLFVMQKSQLQFEQMLITNKVRLITAEMGNVAAAQDSNTNVDDNPYYRELQAQEEFLNTRKESLDTQLTQLSEAVNSMKNVVNTSIKSSCTLNLLGG